MKVGMLWFDDDTKKSLRDKIIGAKEYYQDKHSRSPTVCKVHPITLGDQEIPEIEGLHISASSAVLQDHFWIGVASE